MPTVSVLKYIYTQKYYPPVSLFYIVHIIFGVIFFIQKVMFTYIYSSRLFREPIMWSLDWLLVYGHLMSVEHTELDINWKLVFYSCCFSFSSPINWKLVFYSCCFSFPSLINWKLVFHSCCFFFSLSHKLEVSVLFLLFFFSLPHKLEVSVSFLLFFFSPCHSVSEVFWNVTVFFVECVYMLTVGLGVRLCSLSEETSSNINL